jgi:hypothetical protein
MVACPKCALSLQPSCTRSAPFVSVQIFKLVSSLQETILDPVESKASAQTVEECPNPGPAPGGAHMSQQF